MANTDRNSTGNNGAPPPIGELLYRNVLQESSAPICMFYVAHPYSADDLTTTASATIRTAATTISTADGGQHSVVQTPWSVAYQQAPPQLWSRECVLPPLVQFLASQIGHRVPDLETLIQHIRDAWNSPNCRAALQISQTPQSQHLSATPAHPNHHHYHHHPRTPPQSHANRTAAAAAAAAIRADNGYTAGGRTVDAISGTNDNVGLCIMGSGSHCNLAGPGLLRRRYSMPEIIMRKHSLAQQKSIDEAADAAAAAAVAATTATSYTTTTTTATNKCHAPAATASSVHSTPTHRPPPHRPPRNSTGQQYPTDYNSNYSLYDSYPSSPQRQQPHGATVHTPSDTSMRRQLLRRIWSKEFRQASDTRSGSWSPPLRRSQRRLHQLEHQPAAKCAECAKLELEYASNASLPTATTAALMAQQQRMHSNASSTMAVDDECGGADDGVATPHGDNENNNNYNTCSTQPPASPPATAHEPLDDNRNASSALSADLHQRTDANSNPLPDTADDAATRVDQYIATLLMDALHDTGRVPDTAATQLSPQPPPPPSELTTMYVTSISHPESVIYFPRYTAADSHDDHQSVDDPSDDPLFLSAQRLAAQAPATIAVQSGSTYPPASLAECVARNLMQRTESMEVQRASASPPANGAGAESDNSSLVDSLDDPHSLPEPEPEPEQQPQTYEKSQTFFVPMIDAIDTDGAATAEVSAAMPEKLRERMQRRLHEMDAKRQQQHEQQKQLLLSSIPVGKRVAKRVRKRTDTESDVMPTILSGKPDETAAAAAPVPVMPSVVHQQQQQSVAASKPKTKKYIRAEVGLLESYTIDARGHMQLQEPTPKKPTKKSVAIGPLLHHHRSKTNGSHRGARKSVADVIVKRVQQRSKALATVSDGEKVVRRRDIAPKQHQQPHVTTTRRLYAPASELITPDTECGPRRMYQKTEIMDGGKRIEILEIVECLDNDENEGSSAASSSDMSPEVRASPKALRQSHRSLLSSSSTSSRIPVPILRAGTPCGFQKALRGCASVRGDGHTGRLYHGTGMSGAGSAKVDQMIADLLIEALNHPKELGIEFVNSPREFTRSARMAATVRRTVTTTTMTTTEPAAAPPAKATAPDPQEAKETTATAGSNSSRYQQRFDVIPEEEKSAGSMSVDSSIVTAAAAADEAVVDDASPELSSGGSSGGRNGAKEAVVNGHISGETEAAWIGFFKQHDEGSVLLQSHHSTNEGDAPDNPTTATTTTTTVSQPQLQQLPTSPPPGPTTIPTAIPTASSPPGTRPESPQQPDNSMALVPCTPITPTTTTTPSPPSTAIVHHHAVRFGQPALPGDCQQCRQIDIDLMLDAVGPSRVTMPPRSNISSATSSIAASPLGRNRSLPPPTWATKATPPLLGGGVSAKPALSPIQSVSQKSTSTTSSTDVDSTSFIILRDDDVVQRSRDAVQQPSPSRPTSPTEPADAGPPAASSPKGRCDDCCFCNPDLHKRSSSISRNCSYCNRKRNTTGQSPAHRIERKDQRPQSPAPPPSTSQHSEAAGTGKHNFYETLSKTDHTHVRTRSKNTDTVRLQCTRTNSKIRRFVPAPTATPSATDAVDPLQASDNDNNNNNNGNGNHSAPTSTTRFPPTNNNNRTKSQKPSAADTEPSYGRRRRGADADGAFRSAPVRLPSPFVHHHSSSHSHDNSCNSSSNSNSSSPSASSANHHHHHQPHHHHHRIHQCSSSSTTTLSSATSSPSKQRCPPLPAVPVRPSGWQPQHDQQQPSRAYRQQQQHHSQSPSSSAHHRPSAGNNKLVINNLQASGGARPSRYNNFYGVADGEPVQNRHKVIKEANCPQVSSRAADADNNVSAGWSLTLAGTYREDMAPDVEMRLSFPKNGIAPPQASAAIDRSTTTILHNNRLLEKSTATHGRQHTTTNGNDNDNANNYYDDDHRYDGRSGQRLADSDDACNENLMSASRSSHMANKIADKPKLPMNPKRNLMAANNRTSSTVRLNRNNCSNLPDLNAIGGHDMGRIGARNTIKRSEYSVATVATSATTKTISNYGPGKRAMSYQTLNANSIRIDNHHHHLHHLHNRHHRDHSIDLGHPSGRRMSADSSSQLPTPSIVAAAGDGMSLSVLGNAIAPEHKPRVPTQSERDLTRRTSNACFTRNRGGLFP